MNQDFKSPGRVKRKWALALSWFPSSLKQAWISWRAVKPDSFAGLLRCLCNLPPWLSMFSRWQPQDSNQNESLNKWDTFRLYISKCDSHVCFLFQQHLRSFWSSGWCQGRAWQWGEGTPKLSRDWLCVEINLSHPNCKIRLECAAFFTLKNSLLKRTDPQLQNRGGVT